jgi:signal transduction histidine kinase/DNA-binding response OmpR family regulator
MNLPYGKYKLIVKAYQIQNQSKQNEISLLIRVYPPWYASWIARAVYLLLFLGISTWIIFFYKSRLKLQATLAAEHREKIRIEHINESKMRFFANISHELRTPLTIIIGQLELLLTQRLIPTVTKSVAEIHAGSTKMSKLINELLDFLKYSHGDSKLKVFHQDIIPLIKEEYDSFLSYANIKGIDFKYQMSDDPVFVYFDKLQMQKVFSNLLSNAIKYTPTNGCVSISIEQTSDTVRINFEENGIGIANDVKDKIFERFYQEENEINKDISTTGTGIGLSLANNIVVAHGGKIFVDSQIGKGSVFTVELPKGSEHLNKLGNIEIVDESNMAGDSLSVFNFEEHQEFLDDFLEQQKSKFTSTTSILIVEDDEVIRKLLVQIFDPLFHILEAENGDVGLMLAREKSPDLILSDVMMPKMSGKTLCSMIKTDFDTCHIPVVLLTALSSLDDNISGLNSGADAYITKPFNIKLLVTECVGILNNRRRLQDKFKRNDSISSSQVASNPMDQQFVDKTINIIEKSLESGNVDIGLLCTELGISRTKLFLKMKGITGLTPHEFIQNTKLKLAAKMLRHNPEYNVSDIAFNLGFSSLNYFGKSFKEFFGESPSAYRKKYTA